MMKKLFHILLLSFFYLVFITNVKGQSNFPVTVQVQLVQPFYPYLSDYKQKSIISFTNTVDVPMDIYLQAKIENDRGQIIKTAPGQYSQIPIHLPGMQTVVVQGLQFDNSFFDLQNLQTNLDDRTKAQLYQFGMIPEGFYTYCVTAFRLDGNGSHVPVSDPDGSCAFVNVGYVQPPIILSPLSDKQIGSSSVQEINISWTRPMGNLQGALLSYDLYIVKVLKGQDPALAMQNAVQYGAGIFMKQPNIAPTFYRFTNLTNFQLEEGSEYALMVQAIDMKGKAAFVNNGRSEVSTFTYGSNGIVSAGTANDGNREKNGEDIFELKGKLLWAFKNSEKEIIDKYAYSGEIPRVPPPPGKTDISGLTMTAITNVAKPFYRFNTSLLINSDPSAIALTQKKSVKTADKVKIAGEVKVLPNTDQAIQKKIDAVGLFKLMDAFTATAADSTHSENKTIPTDIGSESYALPGVNVTLSGIAKNSTKKELLGTGVTYAEGNFTIEYLDPAFQDGANFNKLILSVQANDFENTTFEIPVPNGNIAEHLDIGTKTLLARTWRFFPKIAYETSDATDTKDCEVHVYREMSDLQGRPWLRQEGRASIGERKKEVIDGKEMYEIATLKISERTGMQILARKAMHSNSGEGVGRLFYGGHLLVNVLPSSASFQGLSSTVTAFDKSLSANQVMEGEAIYMLETKPSHIEGTVSLFLEGQTSTPISGAAVRIMYHKTDVVEEPPSIGDVLGDATVTQKLQHINFTGAQLSGSALNKVNSNFSGTIPPLTIVPSNVEGNYAASTYTVNPVVSPDGKKPAPPCSGCSYKIAYTDNTGHYYSTGLPVLKPGVPFTVEVIKVPDEFGKFEVRNKGGGAYPALVQLGKGVSKDQSFTMNAEVVDVGGRVVDKDGKALTGVRLVFKGNTLTTSGENGLFVFKLYPGDHAILLKKEGYISKNVTLNIPKTGEKDKREAKDASKWYEMTIPEKHEATLNRIKDLPSVQSSLSAGYEFLPALFGLQGNNDQSAAKITVYNASIVAAFGTLATVVPHVQYEYPRSSAMDMGDIGYMEKITGKIQFTIRDKETDKPVPDAQISLFDTTHITDENGQWYYEGFGGAAIVTVKPSGTSGYVAEKRSLTLSENGEVQEVTIALEKGIKVTGTVTSGSTPLQGARVSADHDELFETFTDNTGHYTLILKRGTHGLSALKQGYVGQPLSQKSIPDDGTVYNFDLQGGNGKNYRTLLGFDIELFQVAQSGGEEIWSGNFIHLHSNDPSVFEIPEKFSIPFSNIKVRFDGSGNAMPISNKIETDLTNIPLKIYGYLPAVFKNGNVVTIIDDGSNKGRLSGQVVIDFTAIPGYRGWKVPGDATVMIAPEGAASSEFVFMQAQTNAPLPNTGWELVTETGKPFYAQLYGFKIHLNSHATVSENGLGFSGFISTPGLSVIKSVNIGIKNFGLNRSLAISGVQIETDNLPKLDIAGWQANFSDIVFNSDGFKIGGKLAVTIPSSGKSEIDFSHLSVAKDEIFGGKFLIPGEGIDLFSVANLNTGGSPLTFGRLGSSNVYRVGGKANLKIDLPVFSKEFKIPTFEVLTNGGFNLQAPVGYTTSLGPFGFKINNIYINTEGSIPYIGIQGNFKTDLDVLKFEVADIKVRNNGSGPAYSIEKVGVTLDIPEVKISASVAFRDNGFEGAGSLDVPATPIHGDVSFRYFKTGGSVELGAHFSANLPPLPIGAIVTLEGVGGGFDYKNGDFSVDINGKLSLLGTGAAVAVDPVGLTVSSRGILKGYGDVTIANYLKTSHAETIFNGPDKTFTVQVSAQMSPLKGLLEQQIKGALVLSAKPGDEYAFLGCSVLVQIAGLVNSHGELAIAVGLKNPKSHDDITAHYFQYAPVEYMQNEFSGVYINVESHLGVPHDKAIGFDITIASAKIWCYSDFQASLILNFAEDAYRIKFGGKFDAGLEACVAGFACIDAGAGLCYLVEGGRNDIDGWNFSATASGKVEFGFGIGIGNCDPDCNEIVSAWDGCLGGAFKVCGAASLDFSYSQRLGPEFSFRAGGSTAPCF